MTRSTAPTPDPSAWPQGEYPEHVSRKVGSVYLSEPAAYDAAQRESPLGYDTSHLSAGRDVVIASVGRATVEGYQQSDKPSIYVQLPRDVIAASDRGFLPDPYGRYPHQARLHDRDSLIPPLKNPRYGSMRGLTPEQQAAAMAAQQEIAQHQG